MSGKENFVSPSDGKRRLSYPTSASVDAPPSDGLDDLQHLPRADDASLLEALRARYERRRVYTHSGSRVILSVNPYSWETSLPLYTAERRAAYRTAAPGKVRERGTRRQSTGDGFSAHSGLAARGRDTGHSRVTITSSVRAVAEDKEYREESIGRDIMMPIDEDQLRELREVAYLRMGGVAMFVIPNPS